MLYLYLPPTSWPDDLHSAEDFRWSGRRSGKSSWILQTYLGMRDLGIDCELVRDLPRRGIVVAHTRDLPKRLLPGRERLIVCIEADRGRRPFCQLHVQQNPAGTRLASGSLQARLDRLTAGLEGTNHFMYYWPQPDLIPRDPARGQRFERVAFMGRVANIAPELVGHEFRERLAAMGLTFQFRDDVGSWNDYREVDAILAVRDFSGLPHHRKPASKLLNAWRAGVPAIVGPESAYLAERRSSLDFLEVRSVDEVCATLERLRSQPELRAQMVRNGRERALRLDHAAIARHWQDYLATVVWPAYGQWRRAGRLRQWAYVAARCTSYFNRIR